MRIDQNLYDNATRSIITENAQSSKAKRASDETPETVKEQPVEQAELSARSLVAAENERSVQSRVQDTAEASRLMESLKEEMLRQKDNLVAAQANHEPSQIIKLLA